MMLAKTAAKAFAQFAKAERKIAQIHQDCGAMLARPFVTAGLYRVIESEIDATVAFERLAILLNDDKEKAAFRAEVAKRTKGEAPKQRRKRTVKGPKAGADAVTGA